MIFNPDLIIKKRNYVLELKRNRPQSVSALTREYQTPRALKMKKKQKEKETPMDRGYSA